MSSDIAISVENLSKAYRIGLKEEIPDTLMGALTGWVKAPLRNWRRLRRLNTFNLRDQGSGFRVQGSGDGSQESGVRSQGSGDGAEHRTSNIEHPTSSETNGHPTTHHSPLTTHHSPLTTHHSPLTTHHSPLTTHHSPLTTHQDDILWALRDVSFEVKRGEVVGIIGRNGAGKSTLLKVLCRITEPTSGRAIIRGRVSSLLEVGTGFHPELTGRENVYMNGTILGMTKREIDRKFDEIVDFSGVEKFLDTPIKRYSSGMKVRLAFAVAAHLEPEILIIDEVLAVGDAEFQQKCLGKMDEVAQSGRTVLFVSHNAGALRTLCRRGVVLEAGQGVLDAPIERALSFYLDRLHSTSQVDIRDRTGRQGCGEIRLIGIDAYEPGRNASNCVSTGQPAQFLFRLSHCARNAQCRYRIFDDQGHLVVVCDTRWQSLEDDLKITHPTDLLICDFEEFLLMPGRYRIDVDLFCNGVKQDHIPAATFFDVHNGPVRGRALREPRQRPVVAMPHRWRRSHVGHEHWGTSDGNADT